jgi:AMP-dependent synthetase/ligase
MRIEDLRTGESIEKAQMMGLVRGIQACKDSIGQTLMICLAEKELLVAAVAYASWLAGVSFFALPNEQMNRTCESQALSMFDQVVYVDDIDHFRVASLTPIEVVGTPSLIMATSGTSGALKIVPHPFPSDDERLFSGNRLLLDVTGWLRGMNTWISIPPRHILPMYALLYTLQYGGDVYLGPSSKAKFMNTSQTIWWLAGAREVESCDKWTPNTIRHVVSVVTTGAPVSVEAKLRAARIVGADKLHEFYGMTEGIGMTHLSGADWLDNPGSVGRGLLTRVTIVGSSGKTLPPGVIGRIYFKSVNSRHRLPSWLLNSEHGVATGDDGYLDEDGHLYVVGRSSDCLNLPEGSVWTQQVREMMLSKLDLADVAVGIEHEEIVVDFVPGTLERLNLTCADVRVLCERHLGVSPPVSRVTQRHELVWEAQGKRIVKVL